MVGAACPDKQRLQRLALGQMAPAEVERLADHCEHCERCIQVLQRLRLQDTLVEAMSAQATGAGESHGQVVSALIERLKARPPAAAAARSFDFLGPAQAADEIGRLGNYRVLQVLGHGGMGVVFQAEDTRLGRTCAVKAMLPEVARKPGMKERFLREARAAAQIEHEHIIPIYQVDEDRGVPFIAMPLLKGQSLEAWLPAAGPVPVPQILKVGREIATGLAAAHERGLIHRDIKPANIFLEESGEPERHRVKILDFGLARLAQAAGGANLTQSGLILGTPAYMAPEQAQGEEVDGRADLFSLGVVLYRMSTGELPFKGDHPMTVLMALAMHNPAPPSALNPTLPAGLSDLVMQLLAKDPAKRPASAREVVKALKALEQEAAGRTGPIVPLARPRRRSRWLGAAVAAGLIAMAAVIYPLMQFFKPNDEIALPAPTQPDDKAALVKIGTPPPPTKPAPPRIYGKPTLRTTLEQGGRVHVLAFAPDGKLICGARNTAEGMDLKIYDPANGDLLFQDATGGVQCLALSPDGKTLYTGGYQNKGKSAVLRLFDLHELKRKGTITVETTGVEGVAAAPDGKTLAIVQNLDSYGQVHFWDLAAGHKTGSIDADKHGTRALKYTPDGRFLIVCEHGSHLLMYDTNRHRQVLRKDTGYTPWVDVSRDSKLILAGGYKADMPVLHLLQLPFGNIVHAENLNASTSAGAFSAAGDLAAVLMVSGSVQLFDVRNRKPIATWKAHPAFSDYNSGYRGGIAFAPDGKTLATSGADGVIKLWDLPFTTASLTTR